VVEPTTQQLARFAAQTTPDGSEINLPSIGLREYDGLSPVTLTRTFRNVGGKTETYRAKVSGLPGNTVKFSPASFTVKPGRTATVKITIGRGTATWDRYSTGGITWHSPAHSVRVTVAARPWGLTPRTYADGYPFIEFGRLGGQGSGYLQPGFTGSVTASSTGYSPMESKQYSLPATWAGTLFDPKGDNVQAHTFTVPAGTAGLVVMTGSDVQDSNLDMYLMKGEEMVDFSRSSWTNSERAWVFDPAPGVYTAYVFAQTAGAAQIPYQFQSSLISKTGTYTKVKVDAPASVQRGGSGTLTLTPKSTLPDVEHWAYTQFTVKGQVVPGLLISSR
jgi:hypothetical protein